MPCKPRISDRSWHVCESTVCLSVCVCLSVLLHRCQSAQQKYLLEGFVSVKVCMAQIVFVYAIIWLQSQDAHQIIIMDHH